MLKREEKKIGDRVFAVTQLPAMRALKLWTRLLKIAGPALAALAGTGIPKSLADADTKSLAPVISTLFEHLTDTEVEQLTRDLLSTAQVQSDEGKWIELFGASGAFDLVMGGDRGVLEIVQLLGFAVEVNFADFFGALRGALKLARSKTPSGSAESTTSGTSGPAGDSSSSG